MKIQQRITWLFVGITALILLVLMTLIYYSTARGRSHEFYKTLEAEASTKASLLLDTGIPDHILQTLYKNNRESVQEVEVAIYDQNFQLIYHDDVELDFVKETDSLLRQIQNEKQLRWVQDRWQISGLVWNLRDQTYLITSAAFDRQGYQSLQNLRNSMILYCFLALSILYFLGRYFSKKSLEPVGNLAKDSFKITANDLHLRLREGPDEIGQLAKSFNEMLERLDHSFQSQQQFVSHLGHEIRTPLASLIGDLEITLSKARRLEDYQETIRRVLQDAIKLSRLSSDLIDLAKASYDRSVVQFDSIRMDELLLDTLKHFKTQFPSYRVNLEWEDESEDSPLLRGNPYLISLALKNLIENACKFSPDHSCEVNLSQEENQVIVVVKDQGPGIPEEDLEYIFTPFFRGKNERLAEGTGIGLTLVDKVIKLHRGQIRIDTRVGVGTTIKVLFPKPEYLL